MIRNTLIGLLVASPVLWFLVVYNTAIYSGAHSVEVTWSVEGGEPMDHTLTVQGNTFVIPKGRKVTRTHWFHGGGKDVTIFGCRVYRTSRWNLQGLVFKLDGRKVMGMCLKEEGERSGTVSVFGIGTKPKMDAVIQMGKVEEIAELMERSGFEDPYENYPKP